MYGIRERFMNKINFYIDYIEFYFAKETFFAKETSVKF